MKYFNLNRDASLGGTESSHELISSQKAIKTYVDNISSGKEDSSNKVTSMDASSTDTQYPSAKAVYDAIKANIPKATPLSYSELKTMKDSSTLSAGAYYRVTDYLTKCSDAGSAAGVITDSAEHAFDIILLASSPNSFNSNAIAVLHEGDTYFASSRLSEWEIKYCFDNDTALYKWAVSDGKGVIYHMKDENGNECGYDFKNIRFKRKWNSTTSLWSDNGDSGVGKFVYTFSTQGVAGTTSFDDISISNANLKNNRIEPCSSGGQFYLNNICSFAKSGETAPSGNIFGTGCSSTTISGNCANNAFQGTTSGCIIKSSSQNTIGSGCENIYLGTGSSGNVFGNDCKGIHVLTPSGGTFAGYFCNNTIESGVSYNTIRADSSDGSHIQNYQFKSSVTGIDSSYNTIELTTGNIYDTIVYKDSGGVIRQKRIEDFGASSVKVYQLVSPEMTVIDGKATWVMENRGTSTLTLVQVCEADTNDVVNASLKISDAAIYAVFNMPGVATVTEGKFRATIFYCETESGESFQETSPELPISGGTAVWDVENIKGTTLAIAQVRETATGDVVNATIKMTNTNIRVTFGGLGTGSSIPAGTFTITVL